MKSLRRLFVAIAITGLALNAQGQSIKEMIDQKNCMSVSETFQSSTF
jgi:hypothetical protein